MLTIFYAGYLGLFVAISSQIHVEMCVVDGNRKKSVKTPILGVQGHSRS